MAFSASAAVAQDKKADKDSQKFIKAAIEGNIAEVDVGKLAQEKGKSDAVKQFGAMLVKDHSAANEKAKQAASQIGVDPVPGFPTRPSTSSSRCCRATPSTAASPRAWSRITRPTSRNTKGLIEGGCGRRLCQGNAADAAGAPQARAAT